MSKSKTYDFGKYAEKFAMLILWLKGYKILQWRYKNNYGEIDIIAKKANFLIFVEVKARKGKVEIESVLTQHQINRIKNCAQYFLSKNKRLQNCCCRFDFIAVKSFFNMCHYINFIS